MNAEDPGRLRELRAEKAGDGKLWQALDALKAIIRDIESGELKDVDQILIVYRRKTGSDSEPFSIGYIQAGLDRPDHIAMLELHKYHFLRDWTE